MTDLQDLRAYLDIATIVVSIGSAAYVFLTKDGRDAQKQVEALEKSTASDISGLGKRIDAAIKERDTKIDEVEDRISRVEGELKGVPDRESVHKMQLEMVAMRGSIDVLSERLKPVAAMATRMHEAMIEERKA